MSSWSRSTAPLPILGLFAVLAGWSTGPRAGELPNRPSEHRGDVAVGAGVGAQYGVAGASFEGRLNFRALGISVALGGPFVPTISLGFWLTDARFRIGLQLHGGFQPAITSCGTDPGVEPSARCHAALLGANVVMDHDVGQSEGLVMRYGLGLTLVAAGGAAVPLPFTLGAAWRW